jgi:hypothetical protein
MKTVEPPLPFRKENVRGQIYRVGCPLVKLRGGGSDASAEWAAGARVC